MTSGHSAAYVTTQGVLNSQRLVYQQFCYLPSLAPGYGGTHLSACIGVYIACCCYAVPHRSLPNLSSGVRWSIDLRWQHPDLPNGFYGLKECIVLTKKGDPNFTPDWKSWAAVDRGQLQQRNMGNESKDAMSQYYGDNTDEDFDATVHGPWMDQWEIVNHNKHTAAHDLKPDIKGKA